MILTLRNQVEAHGAVIKVCTAFIRAEGEKFLHIGHSAQYGVETVHQQVFRLFQERGE